MAEELPDLLTVAEAAKALRVSLRTTYSLIYRGEIITTKVGAQHRIRRDALLAYLTRRDA